MNHVHGELSQNRYFPTTVETQRESGTDEKSQCINLSLFGHLWLAGMITLDGIFRRLNWENKGVEIDGEFLTNLRLADDIFLCTETSQELQHMLQELSGESMQIGLKMNIAKTNVMVVDNTPINVNNMIIENADGYVYLGQRYSLNEKNQDREIQRRIMIGWAAYAKHRPTCHMPEETLVQLICAASFDMVQRPGH